ncbi:MAG: hypothetical protein ACRD1K_13125 [Acidimicrobiales bacterium]
MTIFGEVAVERLACRHRGHPNLYPADAALNLPQERHSHGLRRLVAAEASRGSFEEASGAVQRATRVHVAKRQVEALASRAAVDVEEFYAKRAHPDAGTDDVLVLSADGKGIVMRPDALRPATARAAAGAANKLQCRLSKGEKLNRKRLAEVGAVYDLAPVARAPADVLASKAGEAPSPAPKAKAKWVTASVVENAASAIAKVLDEAERRHPDHSRSWVALVDGNSHPDRPHREGGHGPGDNRLGHGRSDPRARVPVVGGVVLLPRGRSCRRGLGARQGARRAGGQRPRGGCRHPAAGDRSSAELAVNGHVAVPAGGQQKSPPLVRFQG